MGKKLWHVRMLDLPPASRAEAVAVHSEFFSNDNSWYPDSPRECFQELPLLCDIFLLPGIGHGLKLITRSGILSVQGMDLFINLPNKVIRPAKLQNLTC